MKTFLLNEMVGKEFLFTGENAISAFYKYPLGFLFGNQRAFSEKFYNYVFSQKPDISKREYTVYYDCWLFLYTKITGNKNASIHYNSIMKNRSFYGAFSAKMGYSPELRATAVSAICATLEKELKTIKDAADYICLLEDLNEKEQCFYFMMDEDKNLVKSFSQDDERLHVFETTKKRPLLYSFSLAIIALLCANLILKKKRYLIYAYKYADRLMQNDFRNDYCGKSLIAMSILYCFSKKEKYISFAEKIADYMYFVEKKNDEYFHNDKLLTKDRLSEYLIGLIFFENAKNKQLPELIQSYFKIT